LDAYQIALRAHDLEVGYRRRSTTLRAVREHVEQLEALGGCHAARAGALRLEIARLEVETRRLARGLAALRRPK